MLLTAELAALLWHVGPRTVVGTALKTVVACAAVRALTVLHKSRQDPKLPDIESIWDWEPQGDEYASSAWHVLRTLIRTASM